MIVSFTVSNFRSFLDEETLSMVASKRIGATHDDHAISIPKSAEKVLRTAVIYGANGAGKSNLFLALRYVRDMVLGARQKDAGTGRVQFRFGVPSDQPSTFDLQFIVSDKLYRFGFKVDDRRVTEEWLSSVSRGNERVIYERTTDQHGTVTIEAPGIKSTRKKLRALVTVGGPQNQSFLATIRATLQESEVTPELRDICDWFSDTLELIPPDSVFRDLSEQLTTDEAFLKFAGDFLKAASTGVEDLEVVRKEIGEDELKTSLPRELVSSLLQGLSDGKGDKVLVQGNDSEFFIEKSDVNRYYKVIIQARHALKEGEKLPLELNEESDGTQRLLHLLPALHRLRTAGGVFFVDEIDRSMHPNLTWRFLEFFLKSCQGAQRQLILTTHESNLLDLNLLRRDEIWFAEKDDRSATRIYSLSDFRVRKDLEVRKHYLQGRFGAIPFLGNLDNLLPEAATNDQ